MKQFFSELNGVPYEIVPVDDGQSRIWNCKCGHSFDGVSMFDVSGLSDISEICPYCLGHEVCGDTGCDSCRENSLASWEFRAFLPEWSSEMLHAVPKNVAKQYRMKCPDCAHKFTASPHTFGGLCPYCKGVDMCFDVDCSDCSLKSLLGLKRSDNLLMSKKEQRLVEKYTNKPIEIRCPSCDVVSQFCTVDFYVCICGYVLHTLPCTHCDEEFHSQTTRSKHMSGHKSNNKLKCPFAGCNGEYGTVNHLIRHVQANHWGFKYYCLLDDCCDRVYIDICELQCHQRKRHRGVKKECPVCKKEYTSRQGLSSHMKTKHSKEGLYKCELCPEKTFTTSNGLKYHNDSKHNGRKYTCDWKGCNFTCTSRPGIYSHKDIEHLKKKFQCDVCNRTYSSKSHVDRHKKHKHSDAMETCPYKCGFTHQSKDTLRKHIKKEHEQYKLKTYTCHGTNDEPCSKRFSDKSHFKRHQQDVHDIGTDVCEVCSGTCHKPESWKDATDKPVKMCKSCFLKNSGKKTRVEKRMSDYLDREFGTEYLLASDRALAALGGSIRERPDKVYTAPGFTLIVECDENQHSGYALECEQRRMSDIAAEFEGSRVVFVRWNPDTYTPPKAEDGSVGRKTPVKERYARLVSVMRSEIAKAAADKKHKLARIECVYMYYSASSAKITSEFPVSRIY